MTGSARRPKAPWLSVAMPIHRGQRWLRETLASAASQDCRGIEFMLLDSSDSDACKRIADEFAEQLAIRYQHRPDIRPWPEKTNLAVREASAPHVAILHQDDLWRPGRVDDVRAAIAAHPDAALLLNPSHIVDEHGRSLGLWRCPLPEGVPLNAAALAERLLVQNFIAIPAPIIRRDAWLAAGGMDEALWYTADWDLYLKVARQGPTAYRNTASTAFRIHGGSLTMTGRNDRADFADQMAQVIERHIGLAPPRSRATILKRAQASLRINCELAAAATDGSAPLLRAIVALLRLGPGEAIRYLRDSRLLERALPRLRARMAGSL